MGQTNYCFFLHQMQYIIFTRLCAITTIFLSIIYLFVFLFIFHFKRYGIADVAAKPLDCRIQYWVSIEPVLMNRRRKLNFAERGRCASLRLMRRDC